MQQGKKKYTQFQSRASYQQPKGKAKPTQREKPSYPAVDLSKKPVRFYLSKRGKVFPVRVLYQGQTKYGDRARVCLVKRDPEGNAWWCDSENLFYSKREALQVAEEREEVPQEDAGEEGEQEEEEGESEGGEGEEVIPY